MLPTWDNNDGGKNFSVYSIVKNVIKNFIVYGEKTMVDSTKLPSLRGISAAVCMSQIELKLKTHL